MQGLHGDQRGQPGARRQDRPADQAAEPGKREQARRLGPRHDRAAHREEQDLGDHALGPEPADRALAQARRPPVQRREAVIDRVARLQQGGGQQEQEEAPVADQGERPDPPGAARPALARRGHGERGEQRRGERAQDQPQHEVGIAPGDQPARAHGAGDEGDRAPQADPPVVQALAPHRGHGLALDQGDEGVERGRRGQHDEQHRPEAVGGQEPGEEHQGEARGEGQDRLGPAAAVGGLGDGRRGDHPDPGGERQQQPDLGRAQAALPQEHRPERQVDAEGQEHRAVEGGVAERGGSRHHGRGGPRASGARSSMGSGIALPARRARRRPRAGGAKAPSPRPRRGLNDALSRGAFRQ